MNLNKALSIDGWMEPAELQWLAEQAATRRFIVEIGSYKGRSTRALADNTKGLVVAIDDFRGPREIEIADRDAIYGAFVANTNDLKNLVTVKENHRTVTAPAGFVPDMIFIDGSHEYQDVCEDISQWRPLLKMGGLLCGHDYGWCSGVNRAVDERFPERQIAPGTSIWYVIV